MPVPPETAQRLIEANGRFFARCRDLGVPVIHLVTSYRDATEIRSNPFWRTRADDPNATRKNVERHNLEGSVGCEIIPTLYDKDRDWVVNTKKRYDCFVGTDLDFVLRSQGVGMISPPFGLNIFIGITTFKVPYWEVVKSVWPFIIVALLALAIVTYIPELVLWLPRLAGP